MPYSIAKQGAPFLKERSDTFGGFGVLGPCSLLVASLVASSLRKYGMGLSKGRLLLP
jgi:hypothetical protein